MIQRTISTPFGDMRIVGTAETLTELQLPPIEATATDTTPSPALDATERQLAEYFAGERTGFDLPMAAECLQCHTTNDPAGLPGASADKQSGRVWPDAQLGADAWSTSRPWAARPATAR